MHVSLGLVSALPNLVLIIAAIPSLSGHIHSENSTWLSPSILNLHRELGRRLSRNASIYFPGSPSYIDDTARWATNIESNFSVVVVPGMDQDVAATVS